MSAKTKTLDELSSTDRQWSKLAVKNFGPITEGKVELRPLTVFAGPGNTGKSWLAMLIYTMTGYVNGSYGLRGLRLESSNLNDDELLNFPENPNAWLQSLRKDKVLRLTVREQQILKLVLEGGQEALKQELQSCFGLADVDDLVRAHPETSKLLNQLTIFYIRYKKSSWLCYA